MNGVIVRDGDALPEDSGGSSGSGSDDFLSSVGAHDTISLCGSNIPKWQLAVPFRERVVNIQLPTYGLVVLKTDEP